MNLTKLTEDDKEQIIAAEEWLVLQVECHILKLMEKQGVSNKELAKRLGKSEKQVDMFFSGKNMKLREIANIFMALESSMQVDTIPFGFETTIEPQKMPKEKI